MVILRKLFGRFRLFRSLHGGFWAQYQKMNSEKQFWVCSLDPSPKGAYYVLDFERYKKE